MVTIFVPPAIFQEMKAILDLPMATNQRQEIGRRHGIGIEAGDEIACVERNDISVRTSQLSVDAQRDPTAWQAQRRSNVVGIV